MIIIKGHDIHIQKEDGKWLNPPKSYGMIHDPTGTQLDKCYCYIGPYKKSNKHIDLNSDAKQYFGPSYTGIQVVVDIPKGPWVPVTNAVQILYRRRGKYEGKYFHFFNKKTTVLVTRCKKHLRLEFPNGCIVNWRGFVYP